MPAAIASASFSVAVPARFGCNSAQFAMTHMSAGFRPDLLSFALTGDALSEQRVTGRGFSIVPLRLSASRQSLTGMRQ